jgi:hypothetical protein
MIHIIRRNAAIAKEEAERILAADDSDFVVETYVGIHVQRNRERLWPNSAGWGHMAIAHERSCVYNRP